METAIVQENSPHLRRKDNLMGMMLDVLIALAPVVIFAIVKYTWHAVVVELLSVFTMCLAEFVFVLIKNWGPKDGQKHSFKEKFSTAIKGYGINNFLVPCVSAVIFAMLMPAQETNPSGFHLFRGGHRRPLWHDHRQAGLRRHGSEYLQPGRGGLHLHQDLLLRASSRPTMPIRSTFKRAARSAEQRERQERRTSRRLSSYWAKPRHLRRGLQDRDSRRLGLSLDSPRGRLAGRFRFLRHLHRPDRDQPGLVYMSAIRA
jgi:hypothetical protein